MFIEAQPPRRGRISVFDPDYSAHQSVTELSFISGAFFGRLAGSPPPGRASIGLSAQGRNGHCAYACGKPLRGISIDVPGSGPFVIVNIALPRVPSNCRYFVT